MSTIKQRRQIRTEDLKDPGTGARTINDLLLDLYRRIEALGGDVADIYVTINSGSSATTFALAAAGAAPNANAASLAFASPLYTLTLQPADGTYPGIISGANQTLSTGAVVLTMAETHFTNIIKLDGTKSIQFNNSSTEAIRYASNTLTGLQFIGDNFEFQPNAATGQLYYPQKMVVDRLGFDAKDDQSGTPGNFTTTASAGRAAIAAGASTVVITNNTAGRAFAATDDVYWSWIDDDATATGMKVVAAANTITFTVAGGFTATADTRFAWWVLK